MPETKAAYSKVNLVDPDTTPSSETAKSRRKRRSDRAAAVSTKLHALLWIFAGSVTIYFTDLVNICMHDERVNRFWFNLAVILLSIATVLILYMAIYVPRFLKIKYEPQVYSPRMLPVTGICTILGILFLIISLWPVFGLFSPVILSCVLIGLLMTAHFLPAV